MTHHSEENSKNNSQMTNNFKIQRTKHFCLGIPFWVLDFVCDLCFVFWNLLQWWVRVAVAP